MAKALIMTVTYLTLVVLVICWPMFVPLLAYYTIKELKNDDNRYPSGD